MLARGGRESKDHIFLLSKSLTKKDLVAMYKNNHSKKLNTLTAFKMIKIMFEKMLMLP